MEKMSEPKCVKKNINYFTSEYMNKTENFLAMKLSLASCISVLNILLFQFKLQSTIYSLIYKIMNTEFGNFIHFETTQHTAINVYLLVLFNEILILTI